MNGETDRGARRGWDDDTRMALSTAVTSPEAEEYGVKMTSHFPATGSKQSPRKERQERAEAESEARKSQGFL